VNDWIDNARKQREIDFEPKYGPIRPKTDKRCFRREALEELLDGLNYFEWSFRKGEINRKQWQWLDSGAKRLIRIIQIACADKFEFETKWL
jgi:hypothetical protein